MSRCSPFITRPPGGWQETISELSSIRLFLVSTVGPTVFVLKSDDLTDVTFKVFIGERQMCSCGGGEARGQLCFHLLFVMIKVLRVPSDNPIAWQLSLVDSEIEAVLSGELNRKINQSRFSFMKKGYGERRNRQKHNSVQNIDSQEEDNLSHDSIAQKELKEDNICSICLEEMTVRDVEDDILCFCRYQCGTNFHTKCFRMYAIYNRSEKKDIVCPICRCKWKTIPNAPPKQKSTRKSFLFHGCKIQCQECNMLISKEIFRCARCNIQPSYDVCKRCFRNDVLFSSHRDCIFAMANVTDSPIEWQVSLQSSVRNMRTKNSHNQYQLQFREFNDEDYDMLLDLDNKMLPPLHHHLIFALDMAKTNYDVTQTCSICSGICAPSDNLRKLRCHSQNHIAHESCIMNLLIESQSTKIYGNVGIQCPTCNDKSWIFPMLVDDPVSRKNTTVSSKSLIRSNSNKLNSSKNHESTMIVHKKVTNLCVFGSNHNFRRGNRDTSKIRNKISIKPIPVERSNIDVTSELNNGIVSLYVGHSKKEKSNKKSTTTENMIM